MKITHPQIGRLIGLHEGGAPLAPGRLLLRLVLGLGVLLRVDGQSPALGQLVGEQLLYGRVGRLTQRLDHLGRHKVPVALGYLRCVVRQFARVVGDRELVLALDLDVGVGIAEPTVVDALEHVMRVLELARRLVQDEEEPVVLAHQLVDCLLVVVEVEALARYILLLLLLLKWHRNIWFEEITNCFCKPLFL